MRRTTAAVLLAAGLALAGCSSSDGGSTKPTPTATVTKTATPAAASGKEACIQAILDGKDKGDGAAECTGLSLDDYYDALHEANQRNIDELRDEIASASASAAGQ